MRLNIMLYGVDVRAVRVRRALEAQEALEAFGMARMGSGPARSAAEERLKSRAGARLRDRRDYLLARLPEAERGAFDAYRRAPRGGHERLAAMAVLTDLP